MITSNKNKFIVFIICALLLVNIVFTSILWFKQTQKNEHDEETRRPFRGGRLIEMLDLDSNQQVKFKAIKLEHESKMDALKEKEHLAKKAFFDLLKSDTANSTTINTFARKAADASFEIDTTTYFYLKKLKSICTPKQAEILLDIFGRAPIQNKPYLRNSDRPKEGNDTGNNQSVNSVSDKNQNRDNNFNRDDRPPPPPRFDEDGPNMDPGFDPPPPPHDGKRPPGPPPHQRGDRRRPPPPPHERPFDEP
jgi:Spy/CpxP family protein refolding chaperone